MTKNTFRFEVIALLAMASTRLIHSKNVLSDKSLL